MNAGSIQVTFHVISRDGRFVALPYAPDQDAEFVYMVVGNDRSFLIGELRNWATRGGPKSLDLSAVLPGA
jgi:hypothetical protein